jgi:hypothetical protein
MHSFRWRPATLWAVVFLTFGRPGAAQQWLRVPANTSLPIRFLHAISSGRDSAGTPILAQTFGALAGDSCVLVAPFAQLAGHVARSVGGRRLGRGGVLELSFDSLEIRPGAWLPIHAVLDSLEYVPRGEMGDSGVERARAGKTRREAALAGPIAAVADVAVIPVALFEGFVLARRGPRAAVLAGEVGAVRLTAPLELTPPSTCLPVSRHPDLRAAADVPRFLPYTQNRSGTRRGDPVNLLFIGSGRELNESFQRAGWARAHPSSLGALMREATAAIASRPAIAAPVSTLYFEGRKQDLTYERAGPNAGIRDHVRIWLLDSLAGVWAGAATRDVGLRPEPLHARVMHRIDPHVDDERDLITRTLEATSCADLLEYLRLPGADTSGRTLDGQHYSTDARASLIRFRPCPGLPA